MKGQTRFLSEELFVWRKLRNFGLVHAEFLLGCVGAWAQGRQLRSQIHWGFNL